MIQFDLPKEGSSIIKVIGIGGGGSNAVNHMYEQDIDGVNFIIANTDAQAISQSRVPNKVQLGPHLTQGLGAGANPEIGRQATEESLEEMRSILEVNTKMAFVTAGMGGGTGTGGAPIVAKICKDLNILTVGIVTTPFAYEGKKRQLQAEEGIKNLKQYVDTLLVISNDKLRHQFGNLKMKEAFAKADNVLATAAKCITDIINTKTNHINVDFADVCTVMRNGGVAILGNAACEGEGRALEAIEQALASPLLNDNDVRGAKWILINITSPEGEYECTMDEVEVIQEHLRAQTGDETDVILGLGYDNTLENKIGITLIATGFEHRDPFAQRIAPRHQPKEEPRILFNLDLSGAPAPKKEEAQPEENALAPTLSEWTPTPAPVTPVTEQPREMVTLPGMESMPMAMPAPTPPHMPAMRPVPTAEELEKQELEAKKQALEDKFARLRSNVLGTPSGTAAPAPGQSGFLARPANIYAGNESPNTTTPPPLKDETSGSTPMRLVIKDEGNGSPESGSAGMPLRIDAAGYQPTDEERKKAMERLHKLRNISFNINHSDPSNEYESVPAYIRRNMELEDTPPQTPEAFYSQYSVKPNGQNGAQISTINTFLDGKKPD